MNFLFKSSQKSNSIFYSLLISIIATVLLVIYVVFPLVNAVFPSVNLVSVPGEWKPPGPNDQRSPCPALNVLANHGYIPRDGNNVTVQQIRDALDEHLGVSSWFGSLMARVVMHKFGNNGQLSLADLFEHNIIEHDASLTRNDKYFSTDANPSTQLNQTLITQLLSFASPETNRLNVDSLAKARNLRYDQSKTANPEFVFESDQHSNAFGEASLLLNVIGADEREVEVDVANVFLREAKIPDNWKPGKDKVTMWMAYRLRGRISSRANELRKDENNNKDENRINKNNENPEYEVKVTFHGLKK